MHVKVESTVGFIFEVVCVCVRVCVCVCGEETRPWSLLRIKAQVRLKPSQLPHKPFVWPDDGPDAEEV